MKAFLTLLAMVSVVSPRAWADDVPVGTYKRVASNGPICMDSHSPVTLFVAPNQGVIPSLKQNTPWLNSGDMKISRVKNEDSDASTYIAQLGIQKVSHVIKVSQVLGKSFSISFFGTRTDGYGKEIIDSDSRKEICTVNYELSPDANQEFKAMQLPPVRQSTEAKPDLPILLVTDSCLTDGRRLRLSKDLNIVITDQVKAEGGGLRATQAGTVNDTIFVHKDDENCTIQLRMDRFKFLAANAAMYSSGWAQATGDRELCSALHQKLSEKTLSPTPALVISMNDSRQSFANYLGGQSTIHDLQILQLCEVQ